MEAYTRTSSATGATLAFLAAWTVAAARARLPLRRLQQQRLGHRRPRRRRSASATPSPTTSGSRTGTAQADTLDPYVPSSAWARHQRLHQFRGGHDETYGGVTINIDTDYVDGATVGAAAPPPDPAAAHRLPRQGRRGHGAPLGPLRLARRPEPAPGRSSCAPTIRVAARARGVRTKVVRVAVARRAFRLAGGRSHIFRVGLNARAAPCWCREGGSGPSCWSRSPAPAPPVRSSSGGVRSWHHYIGFSDAMM